jgi:hypothetical protein
MPLPEAQAAEVSTEVTDVLTRFRRVLPVCQYCVVCFSAALEFPANL